MVSKGSINRIRPFRGWYQGLAGFIREVFPKPKGILDVAVFMQEGHIYEYFFRSFNGPPWFRSPVEKHRVYCKPRSYLDPPNYPLIYPKYPLLRAIRAPLKGPWGVLVRP